MAFKNAQTDRQCLKRASWSRAVLLALCMTTVSIAHVQAGQAVKTLKGKHAPGILLEDTKDVLPQGVELRKVYKPGIELTKKWEGWVPKRYNDAVGYCTVGYGHLLKKKNCDGTGNEVEFLNGISKKRGEELLIEDMGKAQITVGNLNLYLVTRNSNGDLSSLGAFTVPCTLNSDQKNVAASFMITGAAAVTPTSSTAASTASTASTSRAATPTVRPSSTSSSGSSDSPSPSASNSLSLVADTVSPSGSALATGPGPSNGGDAAWAMLLGGLVLLVGVAAAAYRFRNRFSTPPR